MPPLSLAPMATLSHRALRELIMGFGGCGLFWTEMISASAFVSGGTFESFYSDAAPAPGKVVFQIVGSDPDRIVRTAVSLAERGPFGIDLNMGCAAPEILRQGAGVAWMRDGEAASRLVAAIRAELPGIRLSAKIRAGFAFDEGALLGFASSLRDAGLDFITLHPRLAQEKLTRKPRHDLVAFLARELAMPVIGNGDLSSAAEVKAFLEARTCAGAMIGRAAIKQPWIFAEAAALLEGRVGLPREIDLMEVASRFLSLLVLHQPPEFHISRARRFFYYFTENLSFAHKPRFAIQNAETLAAMEEVLEKYFLEVPGDRLVRAFF